MFVGASTQPSLVENVPRHLVPRFELQQAYCGGRHTLLLAGELDIASAPELGEAVAHIRMDRTTTLVLGLRELTFIDCAGIRAVLVIQALCAGQGCEFSLVPGPRQVQRSFELCGLLDRLRFVDDGSYLGSDLSGPRPSVPDPDRLAVGPPRPLREPVSGGGS
jgi:anti-anti-sigma factor